MPPRKREPVVKRERRISTDPVSGRFVKQEDTEERRRLSVEMLERGSPMRDVANAFWSGHYATAKREVERWYGENPSNNALTLRRVMEGKLSTLETVVREVMGRPHFVVDKGSVVLDAEGKPLLDDQPIYQGVDRILKIGDQLIKITPGLAAPKVTAEIGGDQLDEAIKAAQEELARERALLALEEGEDA